MTRAFYLLKQQPQTELWSIEADNKSWESLIIRLTLYSNLVRDALKMLDWNFLRIFCWLYQIRDQEKPMGTPSAAEVWRAHGQ